MMYQRSRIVSNAGTITSEIDAGMGGLLRRYVMGPGVDEPLVWYEGAGTGDRRYLVADERGSVVAVTDGAGAALGINGYDEHGLPSATSATYRGRFGYTGQAWLPSLGLWYYKARMYSPTLGRFLQADPIGYADGLNWYGYVGGDPVNFIDPSGLATLAPAINICGGGGVGPDCHNPARDAFYDNLARHFFDVTFDAPLIGDGGGGEPAAPGGPPGAQSQSNQCPSPSISSAEAAAAARGDRSGFWNSRAARGDPLGSTAQSIVNDASGLGWTANAILQGAIADRSPSMGVRAIQAEANQIGVEIMRAHVNAVNTFGSPSAAQIAAYHFQVFNAHGLPSSTFGGAPITGTQTEARATSRIWMHCR